MNRKTRRRKKNLKKFFLLIILVICVVGTTFVVKGIGKDKTKDENETINQSDSGINEQPEKPDYIVEPEPEPITDTTIHIAATGDIMFHPSQLDGAYDSSTGTYDFTNSFKAVKSILQSADLAIANFEGTTAGNEKYAYQGYPLFNAPDEVLDALKDTGFDILVTANNHSLDTRKAGVIRTVEQIQARGIDNVGTYISKPKSRVLIKEVKDIKLAFIAYTEMVNGLESVMTPEDLDAMVNIVDETKIKEDIAYAKEQNADLIIAYMHWGNEYSRVQSDRQEILADMLFTEGVDIILGSHPHVIQPSRTIEYNGKHKFVIFSMGNFISNQRIETLKPYGLPEEIAKYTEDGVIVNLEIVKDGETKEVYLKNVEYTPLWVYKGTTPDGRTEHIVYPIMNYIENDDINENSRARMTRSYKDTMALMDIE